MARMQGWWWSFCLTGALLGGPLWAQNDAEKKDDAPAGHKTKLAIIHLDNPTGVAVNTAGNGHVFVVSKQGVFRYVPGAAGSPSKIFLEVQGFPSDVYGKGPMYDIGPLGVTMWGTDRLIVSDGSRKDGEEVVRVYKIADKAPEVNTIPKEDAAEFTLGPIAPGDQSPNGEGNFYASVVWNDAIYVTSNGDDTKGWVLKAEIKDGKPGPLTPAIATKEQTGVDAPIAITVAPDKSALVIGQGGEVNVPGDSLLTFYNSEGTITKKYATGLHDICGLAYSPSGKLYAVDFAWVDPSQGGLFELVIEGDTCTAKKVPLLDKEGKPLQLDRPTSLAFDKDGGLYITVFGTGQDTGDNPKGGVIRVEPGL
uniref:ScyD/ScyE family protein n=1 Tax=Schlesneria paludicola TaxID=360056 RepID=A0A7C4QP19_9PLAN